MRLAILAVLLWSCGGGDAGPPVPARCKAAWDGVLHTGAAKDDASMRERMTLACAHLTDRDLACAAAAKTEPELRDACAGVITALGAAADEQRAHGGTRCRRALRHEFEVRHNDPDLLEDAVRRCEASPAPPRILDCMLAATTPGELDACTPSQVR